MNNQLKNNISLNEDKSINSEEIKLNYNNEIEEEINNEKCLYCGRPFKKYLKDEYAYNPYSESDNYIKVIAYKPACKCDFMNEPEERKKEIIEYYYKQSGLTPVLLGKSFEYLIQTSELKKCKKYAEQFIKGEANGLKLIGNVGTGKTVALACICNYLIEHGYKCYFSTLSALLDKYANYSFNNAGNISDKLEELIKFDLIILDDIGRENYTEKRKEILFRIIDYMINYEIKLAFSSNTNMFDKFKNMPELEAVIDRFNELCPNVIQFKGSSFRGNI